MTVSRALGLSNRLCRLYVGLTLYGISAALMIRGHLGIDPWDVLHQGIARHLHIAIGTVAIAVGAIVLLFWIPLKQRPGLGTISNVVWVGIAMNIALGMLGRAHPLPLRIAELVGGVVLCAIATGLYIGANFGPGPRDGLMTGYSKKTGRSIRLTRACIELTVLCAGWLLGGNVGLGTVFYALTIGPMVQVTLRLFALADSGPAAPLEAVGPVAAGERGDDLAGGELAGIAVPGSGPEVER
jgi:uncharacterized membrane protein YczE